LAVLDDPRDRDDAGSSSASGGMSQFSSQPGQTVNQQNKPLTAQSQGSAQKGSGSFVPFQQYIDANKGQGEVIAGELGQKSSQQAGNIQNQISAKKAALDEFATNRSNDIQQARQFGEGLINSKNYSAPSDSDLARFKNIYDPQGSLQQLPKFDISGEQLNAQNFSNQANNVKTDIGRQQLLKQTYGNQNNYTSGMSNLDNLVLQQNPQAVQGLINQEQNLNQGLQKNISDFQSQVNAQLPQLQQQAQTLTQGPQSLVTQLQSNQSGINQNIINEAAAYNSKLQAESALLNNQLSKGYLTQDEYNKLSPDSKQIMDYIRSTGVSVADNPNLNSVVGKIQANPFDINNLTLAQKAEVASPDEFARMNYLQSLMPENQQAYIDTSLTPQGGNAGFTANELNLNQLKDAVLARQSDYRNNYNNSLDTYSKQLEKEVYDAFGKDYGMGDGSGPNDLRNAYLDINIRPLLDSRAGSLPSIPQTILDQINTSIGGKVTNIPMADATKQEIQNQLNQINSDFNVKKQALDELYSRYNNPLSIVPQVPGVTSNQFQLK
jgi:hypothetical protein